MFNNVFYITWPPGGVRVPLYGPKVLLHQCCWCFQHDNHSRSISWKSDVCLQYFYNWWFSSFVHLWLMLDECAPKIRGSAKGSDMKLRVSLDNLLAAEQVGRWWIVGSSWSGAPMISEQGNLASKRSPAEGQVLYTRQKPIAMWQSTCLFFLTH